MGLIFSHPLFLIGLAAGALPILIHRLTQRKAVSRTFSAVRLILQSQRIIARPQRLKHLILLLLRIMIFLILVLIMAGPVLTREGILSLGEGGPKAILLDNSLSMGFREERETRFDMAKKAAGEIARSLKGQVLVATTASGDEADTRWTTPEAAATQLGAVPLTLKQGDPAGSLRRIQRQLKGVASDKEIIIISDMAHGDWEKFDLGKVGATTEAALTVIRTGSAGRDPNLAVKEVRLSEGEAVLGAPARIEVSVSNLSEASGSSLVQFFLSGQKVDQKSIDLKAREEGKVYFELSANKPGWVNGEVKLSGDRLSADDVFSFALNVRKKVNVLVVDGDPRKSFRDSESYYLASALNPGGPEGSPFLTRVVTEGEFEHMDLGPYEAAFFLNVARPSASKLSSYLESGKAVFLFLGDRISPAEYNRIPLMPWRIREQNQAAGERIVQVDRRREALSLSGKGLTGASFRRYFRIEGNTGNLLAFANKDPLLLEAPVGKGRLFLFASSADADWNDLPLTTGYLPLIQGLVKDAVGLSREALPSSLRTAEQLGVQTRAVQVSGSPGGTGVYRLTTPSGEVMRALNPPFEESDLSKIGDRELQKKLNMKNIKVVEYRGEDLVDFRAGRKDLWPFLLAFLFVIAGAEMVLANRM